MKWTFVLFLSTFCPFLYQTYRLWSLKSLTVFVKLKIFFLKEGKKKPVFIIKDKNRF